MTHVARPAAPAGALIAAALREQRLDKRALARERADEILQGIDGATRKKEIERIRRLLVRWTRVDKPVKYLSPDNAAWIGPRLGLPSEALTRPELSPDERRLAEARRLERKARALRRGP